MATEVGTAGDEEREALRGVLREHYLMQVVCDHEQERDNPICACSRVFLGWHPSVGAAVGAWIEHVMETLKQSSKVSPG